MSPQPGCGHPPRYFSLHSSWSGCLWCISDDLVAKLQFLINRADQHGMLEDHSFTFPDGETWEATRE